VNRSLRLSSCLMAFAGVLAGCSSTGAAAPSAPPVTVAATPAPATAPPAAAATPRAEQRPSAGSTSAPAARPAPTTTFEAPPAATFEEAVGRAGQELLSEARGALGNEPRPLIIDPLIDANTGAQTVSTVRMGSQLEGLVKTRYAGWSVRPFTRETLASKPLLLIGTLTPINTERVVDTPPDAFRVWLTLIDLRTGKVVAKRLDRATIGSVNPDPLPFYRDSPTWHKDKTILGYINSCQINTKPGDPADPDYLARLPAAAVVNEATMAYDQGDIQRANRLYREARPVADTGDLRVLNGLYLTSWKLGQRDEAKDAFDHLVLSGLELKRLPVKMLFEPGKTAFMQIGDLPVQYQLWTTSLAQQAGQVDACIRIVGHTSRTGSARANEALSRQRAEAVRRMLEQHNRRLAARLSATGVGSREALVGIGTDDARDALDRRVEFRVVDCV